MSRESKSREPYIHGLARFQICTLAFVAEGLSNDSIGQKPGVRGQIDPQGRKTVVEAAVSAQLRRVNRLLFGEGPVNRVKLAFWYVDNALPLDMLPQYAKPGNKLRAWRAAASKCWQVLERSGLLNEQTRALLAILADERYVDKQVVDMAAMLSEQCGVVITPADVKRRLELLYRRIGGGNRVRLSVVARLQQAR